MAALREFKVFVRKTSKVTVDYLIVKYKRIMNKFQNADTNKNDDGSYKFIWYAKIFDTRTLKEYVIFCDYGTKLYEIEDKYETENSRMIKGVMYLSESIDIINSLKEQVNKLIEINTFLVKDYDNRNTKNVEEVDCLLDSVRTKHV